jgi:hypothetical protein
MEAAGYAIRQATRDTRFEGYEVWKAAGDAWSDPEALDAVMEDLPNHPSWVLGVTLNRWLKGDDAVVEYLRNLREAGNGVEAGGRWAAFVLLGPRLRNDPRIQAELAAAGRAEAEEAVR